MNLTNLLGAVPLPILVGVLLSVFAPVLSSLIAKEHWDQSITGALTLLISTAVGFFTEWGHAGGDFNWRTAAAASLLSWAVAIAAHSKILSVTDLGAKLLALGSPQPSAGDPDPTLGLEPIPTVTGTSPEVAAINTPEPAPTNPA